MKFEDVMSHIGEVLGLENFGPDQKEDDGKFCHLELMNGLVITCMDVPEHNMMLTTCSIGEIPLEDREAVYREVLEANFMFKGTHGATLSVDAENDTLNLARYDKLDAIDGNSFETAFEFFVGDVVKWSDRLKKFSPEFEKKEDAGATDESSAQEKEAGLQGAGAFDNKIML